ncbi:MAG: hypothetical protein PHR71_02935 [Polaromonas sp.]|nr:hypothetical protein [Polaromonas sp.]
MNWLQKLPNLPRSASGLEWTLWRKLPLIALLGTVLPLLGLGLVHLLADPSASAAQERWLQMADYVAWGVLLFHWTMVLTVGIGCVIVMLMKGPGYVADGYVVSHSDRPRETRQTDEEAASAAGMRREQSRASGR